MSRILVTGSAGTLGTRLVIELRARGHEAYGCDLMHRADEGYRRIDITLEGQMGRIFHQLKPEVCYHLAGEFGRMNGLCHPEKLWTTNCLGTRNVIDACLIHNARLIFASSSEAYGDLADHPGTVLSEDLLDNYVPKFHNEYSLTKWCNERQIEMAVRNHGLKATILRTFNVYGPGEYYSDYRSVVCLFIYRALKGLPITVYSETRRSFLYIDDWVRAVANVLDVPDDTFNIASTRSVTMMELFADIKHHVPSYTLPITVHATEPHNVRDKVADITKAAKALGLTDSVSLEEGIKRTVRWMRDTYHE